MIWLLAAMLLLFVAALPDGSIARLLPPTCCQTKMTSMEHRPAWSCRNCGKITNYYEATNAK